MYKFHSQIRKNYLKYEIKSHSNTTSVEDKTSVTPTNGNLATEQNRFRKMKLQESKAGKVNRIKKHGKNRKKIYEIKNLNKKSKINRAKRSKIIKFSKKQGKKSKRISKYPLFSSPSDCSRKKFPFLTKEQLKLCRRNLNLMPAVVKAAFTSIQVCRHLFKDLRWNCSSLASAPHFKPDLTLGVSYRNDVSLNLIN